jgi:hypothetical protein
MAVLFGISIVEMLRVTILFTCISTPSRRNTEHVYRIAIVGENRSLMGLGTPRSLKEDGIYEVAVGIALLRKRYKQ